MVITSNRAAVVALIGGQYGSEGKGAIAHYLANEFNVHVRSGGPNAGHTFSWLGKKWPMQQVPCGWTNPDAALILTAGALVSIEVLAREVAAIEAWETAAVADHAIPRRPNIRDRLLVDAVAGVISSGHRDQAGGVHGDAHRRYGSTGEGVGVARIARLERFPDRFQRFKDVVHPWWLQQVCAGNTARHLNTLAEYDRNAILLEGTQGVGLSVVHGDWPYTTNHDTGAAQMLADAGLAPNRLTNTILVLRTFPIRVSGNSGPLHDELTWQQMAEMTESPGLCEYTTVTKLPRRIGRWDWSLAEKGVDLNGPDGLALTFLDYLFPTCKGIDTWAELCDRVPPAAAWVNEVESRLGVRAWFVCTGPDIVIDRRPQMQRPPAWRPEHWLSDLYRRGRLMPAGLTDDAPTG